MKSKLRKLNSPMKINWLELADTSRHAFYLWLREKGGFKMNYCIKRSMLEIANSILKLMRNNYNDDTRLTANCFCTLTGAKQLNVFNKSKNCVLLRKAILHVLELWHVLHF